MFKVYINNQDFTQYVDKNRLSIVREIKDYHAEMELFVPISLLSSLEPSVNVQVKNGEKTIFGGIVYTVRFGRRVGEKREVTLTLETYNIYPTRRTISGVINLEPTDPENPELDQNTAGALIEYYIDLYLSEDGILKGNIGRGARLADDLEIYEWDTMSLKEVFDTLGDLTGDTWYIDMEKRLHFASEETQSITHTGEDIDIREENHNYWDFEVEKTLENYINKIFVRGNYPWDEIPEECEDYDGKIKYVQENHEEIQRMAALNGDTGVWGKVVEDEKIEFLETAQRKAEIEFKKYGKMPIRIRVKTSLDIFSPGDKVSVELPTWKVSEDLFTVERVEIEFDENGDVVYILELINNELIGREGLTDVIAKQIRQDKEKRREEGSGNNGGGVVPPPPQFESKIKFWLDMQAENKVELMYINGEEFVYQVRDKVDNRELFVTAYWDTNPPKYKSDDYGKWMNFDVSTEYNGQYIDFDAKYLNLKQVWDIYDSGNIYTYFIVYRDNSPSSGYISQFEEIGYIPGGDVGYTPDEYRLLFPDSSSPMGNHYYGGGKDDLLFDGGPDHYHERLSSIAINGQMVDMNTQKKIRNKVTLLTAEGHRMNTFFGHGHGIPIRDWKHTEVDGNNIYSAISPFFIGDVAEIIIGEGLYFDEIEQINNYLMQKYNIA